MTIVMTTKLIVEETERKQWRKPGSKILCSTHMRRMDEILRIGLVPHEIWGGTRRTTKITKIHMDHGGLVKYTWHGFKTEGHGPPTQCATLAIHLPKIAFTGVDWWNFGILVKVQYSFYTAIGLNLNWVWQLVNIPTVVTNFGRWALGNRSHSVRPWSTIFCAPSSSNPESLTSV